MKRGFFKHILSSKLEVSSVMILFLVPIFAFFLVLVPPSNYEYKVMQKTLFVSNRTTECCVFNSDYVDTNVFNADVAIQAGMNFDNSLWNGKLQTEQMELEIINLMTTDFKSFVFNSNILDVDVMFDTCTFDTTNYNIFLTDLQIFANNGIYQQTIPMFMLKNLYNEKISNSFNSNVVSGADHFIVPSYVWAVIAISSFIILLTLTVIIVKSRKKQQDEEIYDFADESEN